MKVSIILVEIEGGVNLGLITRIAKNFNVNDIRLVNPKLSDEDWELAEIFASKAKDTLEKVKIYDTLEETLKDLEIIFATSAKTAVRESDFRRKFITPKEAAEIIARNRVGIVFGRESTGLTTDEIDKCDMLIHIPTSKKYQTLNLSHSVAIILYEFFMNKEFKDKRKIAPKKSRDRLIEEFRKLAFYTTNNKDYIIKATTAFKNMVNRGRVDPREVNIVLGIIRKASYLLSRCM